MAAAKRGKSQNRCVKMIKCQNTGTLYT